MNIFTDMAIDAFRKQEQKRRQLVRAEAETAKAARKVPSEEFHLWALATEIVRFEFDQKDAIENGPPEDADQIAAALVTMRAQLQDLASDLAKRQAIADREDRPVAFTGDPHAEQDPEGRWLTWPPARELEVGHEYLVRSKDGNQRYPREHRMSFLGPARFHSGPSALTFNARPFAGTQEFWPSSIIATMDLGKSKGRDDPNRYMNKVIK